MQAATLPGGMSARRHGRFSMPECYSLIPVGVVHKKTDHATIEIFPPYGNAMLGLKGFSHIYVIYWFHENDHPQGREVLQVRPRKNPENPVTGVFATHSPMRPNLIALDRCRIRTVNGLSIDVDDFDAREGSPVLDIKCYIPRPEPDGGIRVPEWV
jgi:tRNA (adenine37-N6)-methyltransferase